MAKILTLFVLCLCFISIASASDKISHLTIPLHTSSINLNPSYVQDISSLFVSRQVNCQLIREQGGDFTLEAAESIKFVSPLELIIKLKHDRHFHDGSQITSRDVIASFNYIKNTRGIF